MSGWPQIVFVHGLFSSRKAWKNFQIVLSSDPSMCDVEQYCFEYFSPTTRFSRLRKIPSFDDLGDRLRIFVRDKCDKKRPIILVSHSQGGLIVQRFLSRSIESEQYDDIRSIKMIVMFACPNSGSDLLLSVRRFFVIWRHSQERELRPLNRLVTETRRTILRRIVNADPSDPASTHIPIFLYAGDEDNVVTSVSALDVFPAEYTGVISGDHSSIIQPAGVEAESYRALRRHIMHVIEETDDSNGTDELEQATAFCTSDVTDIPTLVEKAEDYARQGQNALAEATFLQASSTGDLYALQAYSRFQRQQGQLDRSIATSSLVIEKLAGAEDSTANRVMRSRVLSTIGISQRNLGKLQQSERSLREAASASRGDEDDVAELDASAYALDNLGLTLMRSAEIRAAKGAFYDARKIRENLPDKSKLAPSFLNIARIELREGNFDAAEKDCAMAISLWDPDKDAASLAAGYSLQGEIAYAAEDYDSAEKSFSEALRLNNSIGRGISIALTQQQLSRISLMRGDFVAAEAHARKSLENCVLASNTEGQVGAKQLLGRIASSNGDRPGAVNMLEDCVTSYRELGNLTGEAWSSFYLAEVLYQLGRADSGAARLQRATALADWITNASLRRAVETFSPG